MSAPYSYSPRLRFTSQLAGPPVVYDLSAYRFVTVCRPMYEPIFVQKEMLDRSTRNTRYGWRAHVRIVIVVTPGSSEDVELAGGIQPKLIDEDWECEVSLDAGITYRAVDLTEWERPAIEDKNVGAILSMLFTVRELLKSPPPTGGPPGAAVAPPALAGWA